PALVEREAVYDPRGMAALEEMEALEPERLYGRRLAQRLERAAHRLLHGTVERRPRREVQPVEVVEGGHAEEAGQPGADEVRRLAVAPVDGGRGAGRGELAGLGERGGAPARVGRAGLGHHSPIGVRE